MSSANKKVHWFSTLQKQQQTLKNDSVDDFEQKEFITVCKLITNNPLFNKKPKEKINIKTFIHSKYKQECKTSSIKDILVL